MVMMCEDLLTTKVLSLICSTQLPYESQRMFMCKRKTQDEARVDVRADVPADSDTIKLGLGISV